MSELAVKQALQEILKSEFDRVYLYPEEYDDMPALPEMPFLIIQANPSSIGQTTHEGMDFYPTSWEIDIMGYVSFGLIEPPSAEDAAFRTAVRIHSETIRNILKENLNLRRTIYRMGNDVTLWRDYAATELPWNKTNKSDVTAFDGFIFEIPVMSD